MKIQIDLDFKEVDPEMIDPNQKNQFPRDLEMIILEYFDLPGLKVNIQTSEE